MNPNKDIKGRFCSIIWTEDKKNILISNIQVYSKKELCKQLEVNQKFLNRKIRELGLNLVESFDCKYKKCTKCKEVLPKTRKYFSTNIDHNSILFRSACKKCTKEITLKNQSTLDGYIKSLLYSKKHDKRTFIGNYNIDFEFIKELYLKQEGKCAITNLPMTYIKGKGFNLSNISIDRKDSIIGYSKDNIQLVCLWANVSKNYLTMDSFKKYVCATYNNLKLYNNV